MIILLSVLVKNTHLFYYVVFYSQLLQFISSYLISLAYILLLAFFYLIPFHKLLLPLRISKQMFNTFMNRVFTFSQLYGYDLASRQ
jgi:hypothetical protein